MGENDFLLQVAIADLIEIWWDMIFFVFNLGCFNLHLWVMWRCFDLLGRRLKRVESFRSINCIQFESCFGVWTFLTSEMALLFLRLWLDLSSSRAFSNSSSSKWLNQSLLWQAWHMLSQTSIWASSIIDSCHYANLLNSPSDTSYVVESEVDISSSPPYIQKPCLYTSSLKALLSKLRNIYSLLSSTSPGSELTSSIGHWGINDSQEWSDNSGLPILQAEARRRVFESPKLYGF